jgi:hypothetical protein
LGKTGTGAGQGAKPAEITARTSQKIESTVGKEGTEEKSLVSLLEDDEEQVLAALRADRSAEGALKVLEKETDRLMLRAGELDQGEKGRESAQYLLQTVRGALPLIGAVRESERWEIQSAATKTREFPRQAAILFGAGVLLILLSSAFAGGLIFKILWGISGSALTAAGGYFYRKSVPEEAKGRTKANLPDMTGQVQEKYLIDAENTYHVLKGILLTADHCLETEKARALSDEIDVCESEGTLSQEEAELFSSLLESAYAARRKSPGDGRIDSQISEISYYLHRKGVEILDYEKKNARFFEILPSPMKESLTIRPALLSGGAVIRKGLAAMEI